ncbi:DUF1593 domain-containing protein [Pseudoduganella namucuonensis]|uniref:DUF1593 domain-containing protein n=1 Tax=Pseudoduganella namucuonensis TaxID=1035707 RepID=A0A1I7KU07_9BURK|nr:DUF1593 domain-containing protein [Pseudoduganella namucuonensis]SFV00943.1 Protein of unknown function [Pseudoduganella namucuonensis]
MMRLLPMMLAALLASVPALGFAEPKQRLIVLSDIEADPDDSQSLVRLLLYANQIDIEGIVATTSTHQKSRIAPESMHAIIDAYGRVQPNLLKHEPGFPKAETLKAVVRSGSPLYGMQGVGDGRDSQGSDAIIKALEKNDTRPLWVSVWGGANTLAQALYRISHDRTPEQTARLLSKLRVYTISDQDDSGIWIRTRFPDLFYIVSPGGYGNGTWTGMHTTEPGFDSTEVSNNWIATHIQQGHGPLGAIYPDVAFSVEGDTPSFLSLIPNGLNAPEHPDWGGWGGRYELYTPALETTNPEGFTGNVPVLQEPRAIWTNAVDSYRPMVYNDFFRTVRAHDKVSTGYRTTIWRWRKDFQNDFAARMDWTTKPYKGANHPPVVKLGHGDRLTVKSGEDFTLSAAGSSDPDGDSLGYLWFHYPEAGSYREEIKVGPAENLYAVGARAPVVSKTETAHFIVKVTDKGSPALTRYRRVIVTIVPPAP